VRELRDERVCDNAEVVQYRRLSALLLGAWLGAGILADVAVTQNFQTVDRFLETPGSITTSMRLNEIGRARARVILRRNAGEENNWIFENWERVELALGVGLFLLLLFGERPQKLMLGLSLGMFLIVVSEHFLLTPPIIDLGRKIDDLPATDPSVNKFWMLHGLYSGLDILKLVVGLVLGIRLAVKRKPDPNQFAREYREMMASGGKSAPG
jgi:hypothetical protein